ncbi:MAG: hypothetical protein AAB562_04135 [Patescibacteria group bacterium]
MPDTPTRLCKPLVLPNRKVGVEQIGCFTRALVVGTNDSAR